jgi:hypothetical protein
LPSRPGSTGVTRLVFAHIGHPSLSAIDAGYRLPFGEWGKPGRTGRMSRNLEAAFPGLSGEFDALVTERTALSCTPTVT